MSGNLYLMQIIRRKKAYSKDRETAFTLARELCPYIRKWARQYSLQIIQIIPSGSYAKYTSVKGMTDIDLFISLRSQTPFTLKEIYNSLYNYFSNLFIFAIRKQNVSIRINYSGKNIDLVPAKRMPNVTYPHSLYVSKKDTWTKTNIQKHISLVRNSRRRNEIVLTKIWRELHSLDFPSFYLELSVIEALKRKKISNLEENMMTIFEYLMSKFKNARIVDPSNSENIISDDLSDSEKQKIAEAASRSYEEYYWNNIIW